MLPMPKKLDLKIHTLSTENIVLKLPSNAKKNLEYFFNAINFIYSELKKNNQVHDIKLFLLSLKPKIDCFIGTKNKEPIYKLLNVAINQWLKEDTGVAYLRLDQPSKINKQYKISIPLQNCNEVDFICPDIYKRNKSALYDPYIKIMQINNIFIAEVITYYRIKTPKKFYVIDANNQISNVNQQKFNEHSKTLKYKKPNSNRVKFRPKNPQTLPIQINDNSKASHTLKESSEDQEKISAWFEFRKKSQENSNSINAEMASEILEAFKEVKARRSKSNNEYLQNFYENGNLVYHKQNGVMVPMVLTQKNLISLVVLIIKFHFINKMTSFISLIIAIGSHFLTPTYLVLSYKEHYVDFRKFKLIT